MNEEANKDVFIVLLRITGNKKEAIQIVKSLLEERLIAFGNMILIVPIRKNNRNYVYEIPWHPDFGKEERESREVYTWRGMSLSYWRT